MLMVSNSPTNRLRSQAVNGCTGENPARPVPGGPPSLEKDDVSHSSASFLDESFAFQ
jgi:hypothetical protein